MGLFATTLNSKHCKNQQNPLLLQLDGHLRLQKVGLLACHFIDMDILWCCQCTGMSMTCQYNLHTTMSMWMHPALKRRGGGGV